MAFIALLVPGTGCKLWPQAGELLFPVFTELLQSLEEAWHIVRAQEIFLEINFKNACKVSLLLQQVYHKILPLSIIYII